MGNVQLKKKINLVVLLHGPYTTFSSLVVQDALRAKSAGYVSRIVISSYAPEFEKIPLGADVEFIENNDLPNAGFYNINRQINLVRSGLEIIDSRSLVLKLRLDQRVNIKKLTKKILSWQQNRPEKSILTTDSFTRLDRLFHPSDMLLVGRAESLSKYYGLPFLDETHVDIQLRVAADSSMGKFTKEDGVAVWPESLLFSNFLSALGLTYPISIEGSLRALEENVEIVSSFSIGMKWEKFFRGKILLLPYQFTQSPFVGGPVEVCECYYVASTVLQKKISALFRIVLWHPYLALLRAPFPGSHRLFLSYMGIWLKRVASNPRPAFQQIFSTLKNL